MWKMTEYKLVPVDKSLEIVRVVVPNDVVAYRSLDLPQLTKNPKRCKKLFQFRPVQAKTSSESRRPSFQKTCERLTHAD